MARAEGVNANQVFKWRGALKRGELNESASRPTPLLPVMLPGPIIASDASDQVVAREQAAAGGSIHIEFPGLAMVSAGRGGDASLLRLILERLRE